MKIIDNIVNELSNNKNKLDLFKEEYSLRNTTIKINLGSFVHEISKLLNILGSDVFPLIKVNCIIDSDRLNELLIGNIVDVKGNVLIDVKDFKLSTFGNSSLSFNKSDNMIMPQLVRVQYLVDSDFKYDELYVDLYSICIDVNICTLYYSLINFCDCDRIRDIISNSCIIVDKKILIKD